MARREELLQEFMNLLDSYFKNRNREDDKNSREIIYEKMKSESCETIRECLEGLQACKSQEEFNRIVPMAWCFPGLNKKKQRNVRGRRIKLFQEVIKCLI